VGGGNDNNNNNNNWASPPPSGGVGGPPSNLFATFCLRVTNIGDTFLFPVTITDKTVSASGTSRRVFSAPRPLPPWGDFCVQFDNVPINGDTVNLAKVAAVPSDSAGGALGLPTVFDRDFAAVLQQQKQQPNNITPW